MRRKVKNIHYIYKTTCNVTGRWYVGMHSTCNEDDGYMGSGLRLRRSIRKYGIENHTKEILEYYNSRDLLIEAEKKAITPEMVSDITCMNLMCGGQGGFISEEQQKHRSSCGGNGFANKLKTDDTFKEYHSSRSSELLKITHENAKIKYNTFEGKSHSEETKQLMSEKAKNRKSEQNSQYGTCWITNGAENKKIKKEDLDNYILKGWLKGRKIK